MSIEYSLVDWPDCLEVLVPGASYTRQNSQKNQDSYENFTTWDDVRPKPTWDAICNLWTNWSGAGSGVLYEPFPPGFRMLYPKQADFGRWLYVDPVNGRKLSKTDYAMLYKVIGNVYNSQYGDILSTEFGLPKSLGGRAWLTTNSTYPYGSMAGSATHTLTVNQIPAHTHTLPSNLAVQQAGLTLFGYTALLGTPGGLNTATTGSTGAGASNPIPTMSPYWSAGYPFIYMGKLKYDDQGGSNIF